MKRNMVFGTMIAKPGEKVQGLYTVEELNYQFPVTIINGMDDGSTILITAGIHGGEFVGIQAAIELAGELNPDKIAGGVVVISPVNVSAFHQLVPALLPEAGENLNRLFPGETDGGFGQTIAFHLTSVFQDQADFYLDLHGGDLHEELVPFVFYPGAADDEVMAGSKAIARKLNVHYMLKSQAVNGAYNSAARRGIPSILIERGGCGRWSKCEVDAYKDDIRHVLSALHVIEDINPEHKGTPLEICNPTYLESEGSGCWYPRVFAGERIQKNQLIGVVKNFWGEILVQYYAQTDGVVLYHTTSLSVTKGSSLLAYAEIEGSL